MQLKEFNFPQSFTKLFPACGAYCYKEHSLTPPLSNVCYTVVWVHRTAVGAYGKEKNLYNWNYQSVNMLMSSVFLHEREKKSSISQSGCRNEVLTAERIS